MNVSILQATEMYFCVFREEVEGGGGGGQERPQYCTRTPFKQATRKIIRTRLFGGAPQEKGTSIMAKLF